MIVIWTVIWRTGVFRESAFSGQVAVLVAREEARSGSSCTYLIHFAVRVTWISDWL